MSCALLRRDVTAVRFPPADVGFSPDGEERTPGDWASAFYCSSCRSNLLHGVQGTERDK